MDDYELMLDSDGDGDDLVRRGRRTWVQVVALFLVAVMLGGVVAALLVDDTVDRDRPHSVTTVITR